MEDQPLILSTGDLMHPEGRRFWLDDSMFPLDKEGRPTPNFSVQEVANVFFGENAFWLRWRMRPARAAEGKESSHPHGYFVLDGKPLEFKRRDKGSRYFTLADIERMAHALAQQNLISGLHLANIVLMVRLVARIHGINDRAGADE